MGKLGGRMNPYAHLVAEYARFFRTGKDYPLGGFPPLPRPQAGPSPEAPPSSHESSMAAVGRPIKKDMPWRCAYRRLSI